MLALLSLLMGLVALFINVVFVLISTFRRFRWKDLDSDGWSKPNPISLLFCMVVAMGLVYIAIHSTSYTDKESQIAAFAVVLFGSVLVVLLGWRSLSRLSEANKSYPISFDR